MSSNRWFSVVGCATAALLLCVSRASAAPFYVDPTGDTFGAGPVFQDITTYTGLTTPYIPLPPPATMFTVNFLSPISPPSAFAANSVVGYIDIDIDRNPATGGTAPWGGPVPGGNSWINFFVNASLVPGPLINLGDEFFVDLFSEAFHPGFVDVIDTNDNSVFATVAITFTSQGFSLTVPLQGTSPSFAVNFGLLVGTFAEPTDRAPNGETPAQSFVPEPGSLALFGMAGLGLLSYGWAKHRPRRRAVC